MEKWIYSKLHKIKKIWFCSVVTVISFLAFDLDGNTRRTAVAYQESNNSYCFQNPAQENIYTYLKNAKTIAVVGLTDREDTAAYQVAQFLQDKNYTIIPVNSEFSGQEILGQKVYARLQDIPVSIDIVDVFRRSELLSDVAHDFIETNAKVFWAQLGLENEEAENILRTNGRNDIVMNRCLKIDVLNFLANQKKELESQTESTEVIEETQTPETILSENKSKPANLDYASYIPDIDSMLTYNVKDFGATGDGITDDTKAIQDALDAVGNSGKSGKVIIPSGTYIVNGTAVKDLTEWGGMTRGLAVHSNTTIIMENGAVLQVAENDYKAYNIFWIYNVENINIKGGTLIGDRKVHTIHTSRRDGPESDIDDKGEMGHGIVINSSKNIVIEDVTAKDFWGDGFILADYAASEATNENIVLNNVTSAGNRRQGLSIIDANGVKVLNSVFFDTGNGEDGVSPGLGIDIEPESRYDYVNNLEIAHNTITGSKNAGIGFNVEPSKGEKVTNVNIHDNEISNNFSGGIYADGVTNSNIVNNSIYHGEYNESWGICLTPNSTGNTISGNIMRVNAGESYNKIVDFGTNNTVLDNHNVGDNNTEGSVTIEGEAETGQTLKAIVQDGDGNTIGATYYQWYADGLPIYDAVRKEYTLSTADVGKKISVSAATEVWLPQSAQSTAVTDITTYNQKPTITITTELDGNTVNVQDLSRVDYWTVLTATVTDPDGMPLGAELVWGEEWEGFIAKEDGTNTPDYFVTVDTEGRAIDKETGLAADKYGSYLVKFQWYADGVPIEGAVKNKFTPKETEINKQLSVKATYIDQGYHYEQVISSKTLPIYGTYNKQGVITIIGKVAERETLTASLSDDNGARGDVGYRYQWYADGEPIAGALSELYSSHETTHTYTVSAEHATKSITVRIIATDPKGIEIGQGYRDWDGYWNNPLGIAEF